MCGVRDECRMIKFFDLTKQYQDVGREIEDSVKKVLSSGSYILGENVRQFEESFAEYIGTKYCIGVANGTDAIMLSLKALKAFYDKEETDEIITVPNTYVATVEAIVHAGYKPVFVDIDTDTGLMDLNKLESSITKKTIGIVPVHLYGQCVDMERLSYIAKKHDVIIIEDACQAHGASFLETKAGAWGTAGCFSFYPSKNLGCMGDGGAITTNDTQLYEEVLALRDHGQFEKSIHSYIGHNSRLDEIQACILNVKLKRLEKYNDNRRKLSWIYSRNFMDSDIEPLEINPDGYAVFHLFVVKVRNRDKLAGLLKSKDIGCGIHYPVPIHLQPAYKYLGYKKGDFPQAENFCNEIISLPFYPEMSLSEVSLICRTILNAE